MAQPARLSRVLGIVVLALAVAGAAGPAAAAKWKPKLPKADPVQAGQAAGDDTAGPGAEAGAATKGNSSAGKSPASKSATGKAVSGKAASARKPGTRTAGASGDAAGTDLPTGALVSHGPGGESIGKDCFVVKKRTLVPGTGYMIRRSTFCN